MVTGLCRKIQSSQKNVRPLSRLVCTFDEKWQADRDETSNCKNSLQTFSIWAIWRKDLPYIERFRYINLKRSSKMSFQKIIVLIFSFKWNRWKNLCLLTNMSDSDLPKLLRARIVFDWPCRVHGCPIHLEILKYGITSTDVYVPKIFIIKFWVISVCTHC